MIYIVSGLPCSGLSLLVEMLQAGGISVFVDQSEKTEEDFFKRSLNGNSYEYLARFPKTIRKAKGKVLKLYSMYLYNLPPEKDFRVLYINRDLQDIVDAGHALSLKNPQAKYLRLTQKAYLLGAHRQRVKDWMAKREGIEFLNLHYDNLVTDPFLQSLKIRNFLDRELDIEAMSEIARAQNGAQNAVNAGQLAASA